jgi:hypothetical protein
MQKSARSDIARVSLSAGSRFCSMFSEILGIFNSILVSMIDDLMDLVSY